MRKPSRQAAEEYRETLGLTGRNRQALAGFSVILIGQTALFGTVQLAEKEAQALCARMYPGFVRSAVHCMPDFSADDVRQALQDVSALLLPLGEGGILAGLWKLACDLSCGMRIDMKAIPIRQESVEICEYFGINPYELHAGGALLCVTEEEKKLLAALAGANLPAAVIGTLSPENDCILCCDGRTGYLNRPQEDPLVRLLASE